MKLPTLLILCTTLVVVAKEITIAKWKGDAHASFSLILDDFGCEEHSESILKAGVMAAERGLPISTAVIVNHIIGDPNVQWRLMNSFVALGHEVVNHSWNHDDPQGNKWNQIQDMLVSRDSIEANLADSVWQKKVTFFAFPYDGGGVEDLQFLKEHGYLGARFTEFNTLRVNISSQIFDPFYSDFYPYISQEYIDSNIIPEMLAKGEDTAGIEWWLGYPDKEYPPYNEFTTPVEQVELRHIEMALKKGAWGFTEMHAIAPKQLYPPLWSPMSYDKYTTMLDRLAKAKACDSLWVDIPSRVAAYVVLSNRTTLSASDSLITFEYGDLDPLYFTELTLKIPTKGATLYFSQNGKVISPYTKSDTQSKPDIVYIDVDPSNGPIHIKKNEAPILPLSTATIGKTRVTILKNEIACMMPTGTYIIDILDLKGRKQFCSTSGNSSGISPITITHSLASGMYVLSIIQNNVQKSSMFQVP